VTTGYSLKLNYLWVFNIEATLRNSGTSIPAARGSLPLPLSRYSTTRPASKDTRTSCPVGTGRASLTPHRITPQTQFQPHEANVHDWHFAISLLHADSVPDGSISDIREAPRLLGPTCMTLAEPTADVP